MHQHDRVDKGGGRDSDFAAGKFAAGEKHSCFPEIMKAEEQLWAHATARASARVKYCFRNLEFDAVFL